jgi:hypothetical protein
VTHKNGEESPESDEVLVESPLTVPSNHCLAVASVSPTNALASGSGGLALAREVSTGSAAAGAAKLFQTQITTVQSEGEMLAPLVEDRIDGETFAEKMARCGLTAMSPSWRTLYLEFQQEVQRRADLEVDQEDEVQGWDPRDDDGAVYFDDGSGGEGRGMRVPPDVPTPSREMMRRHRAAGHSPYRPWCSFCVRGACNAPPHKARADTPLGDVPEVHCDYGFFKNKKGDTDNVVNVLVTVDRKSTGICADVVPRKGVGGGFAVKQLNRNLKKFGHHSKVVMRSDGEFDIRDLLDKLSAMRASETVLEHTPVGDSKANGRAERAVQSIEKQTRVLKLGTEAALGSFGVQHACFPWLVMHAADVINKFRVGVDGTTAYEKIKGRAYSGQMYEFGSCVLYKIGANVMGGDMSARWQKGIW